ncbi:class I SAM-dependent methyltransferase [Bifidobacterium moraviense]|nr:class I SAM-dependent methyltransferase [Bifidobacterium sp. DSM 109958]
MLTITDDTRAFVVAHADDDVRDLALHAPRDGDVDVPFALDQIAGRRKARTKLPQWAACDGIVYPPHLAMEQCSSQFTARYKTDLAARLLTERTAAGTAGADTSLVDLTGGFGVDFSYMARVFDRATYVERQEDLCELAEHNMAALGLDHVEIVHGDSVGYLDSLAADSVSMAFVDPARRDAHGARTYAIADCTPDVLALKDRLLAVAPIVMVKLSPMLDWRRAVEEFRGAVREVHIVATGNECKDLLLVLARERTDAPRVFAVNDGQHIDFVHGVHSDMRGEAAERTDANAQADANAGDAPLWLYEPNAAVMKAGCFGLLSRRWPVDQIAPNSHLFLGRGERAEGFPGRAFAVEAVSTMNKRELRAALAGLAQANVAVRNFPLSVAQLRRRLGLRDGGDAYLFATTSARGEHLLYVTRRA